VVLKRLNVSKFICYKSQQQFNDDRVLSGSDRIMSVGGPRVALNNNIIYKKTT